MKENRPTCPLSRREVLDRYFLEHRAKLIDLAAFLDRVDRSAAEEPADDFRLSAFRRALAVLSDTTGHRAKRVLEVFSDPTTDPLESAAGMKGATGAWPGAKEQA